jgi:cell division inhibitor SulA/protein ImuA
MPQTPLNKLLNSTPQLWKGRRANHSQRSLPTGHARLDARLPGQGWPLGAVTELISARPGLGEFSLLFPTLADIGKQGQWLVLVDPPWIPYPAALHGHGLRLERLLLVRTQSEKESLWACEQALRGSRGGAVLGWPERISFTCLRRLQLAASENGKLLFLFRPEQAADTASPAALRLKLEADRQRGTCINVLKCRGNRPLEPAWIPQPYSGTHIHSTIDPERPEPPLQTAPDQLPLPVSTAIN